MFRGQRVRRGARMGNDSISGTEEEAAVKETETQKGCRKTRSVVVPHFMGRKH